MYKRSHYSRGRRGMTFKFKPPKKRKYKSAVYPKSSGGLGSSNLKLNLLRILVAVLIVGIVAGGIITGVHFFINSSVRENSSSFTVEEENHDDELLRVVNKTTPLEKTYVPDLVDKGTYKLNPLAEKSLDKLLAAAEKEGISLYVKYAYVSYDEQKKLYEAEYKRYIKEEGLSEVKAQAKTNLIIPQAGRSEFQTGLMVSFRSKEKGKFKNSKASAWLDKNAKDYGFVLRYPDDKEDVTSMNANFKSYRYVGEENAEVMQSLNMCLNEYSYYVESRK